MLSDSNIPLPTHLAESVPPSFIIYCNDSLIVSPLDSCHLVSVPDGAIYLLQSQANCTPIRISVIDRCSNELWVHLPLIIKLCHPHYVNVYLCICVPVWVSLHVYIICTVCAFVSTSVVVYSNAYTVSKREWETVSSVSVQQRLFLVSALHLSVSAAVALTRQTLLLCPTAAFSSQSGWQICSTVSNQWKILYLLVWSLFVFGTVCKWSFKATGGWRVKYHSTTHQI